MSRASCPVSIYFVTTPDRGMVKIGASSNCIDRLSDLMQWSPVPLELAASARGSYQHERALHFYFRAQHSHKEWFRRSDELDALIRQTILLGDLPSWVNGIVMPIGWYLPGQKRRGPPAGVSRPWSPARRNWMSQLQRARHGRDVQPIKSPNPGELP
jgi:hypothetical protein